MTPFLLPGLGWALALDELQEVWEKSPSYHIQHKSGLHSVTPSIRWYLWISFIHARIPQADLAGVANSVLVLFTFMLVTYKEHCSHYDLKELIELLQ